ncbi:MAG: vWA domain-containing protein [Actinomycetes bacterium]
MTAAGRPGPGLTTAGGVDPDEVLLGFACALRTAGMPVTPERSAGFVEAARWVGAADADGLYWAGRATLCSSPQDRPVYDRVFTAWFSGMRPGRSRGPSPRRPTARAVAALTDSLREGDGAERDDVLRASASDVEVLRHRDVAELSPEQRAELARLFSELHVRLPNRSASRRRPGRRGEVDARRTVREQLRRGGEVGPLRWRRRGTRPRPVVMLVDVSGSMTPYCEALLRLGHLMVRSAVATGGRVEVFSMGTRLTRLTPALRRSRDADVALRAAGDVVPDWSGGTRLGEVLAAFVRLWGRRGLARGAVVVICSDGWERGDPGLLRTAVEQLHRLAHRVIWVNPHRGKHGYRPVQSGIVAVLPHVDALVAGHSLATLERLLRLVADDRDARPEHLPPERRRTDA